MLRTEKSAYEKLRLVVLGTLPAILMHLLYAICSFWISDVAPTSVGV
jgi:hypothetical protein